MGRHINIPIFIPHLGCPNQCVFCNQRTISGTKEFDFREVVGIIEKSLVTTAPDDECEIAFFGGSFTGIERNLMISLLNEANKYIKSGRIKSIRCSTRPDYIDDDILDLLWDMGVRNIELGLQSVSDSVLMCCKRGHGFTAEADACRKVVQKGFTLGGQMMIGLPGATEEDELTTAEFIVNSGAKEARIYPTVVFRDTELYDMTLNGVYEPLTTEAAVVRTAKVFKILSAGGVKILRVGLCDSENLHNDSTYYAGPNHPAIGELVVGEVYYNIAADKISRLNLEKNASVTLEAPLGQTSKVAGHKRRNKDRLKKEFGLSAIKVIENSALCGYELTVYADERK